MNCCLEIRAAVLILYAEIRINRQRIRKAAGVEFTGNHAAG